MSRAGAAGSRRRIKLSSDTRLLALALASGCVDAISYVGLAKVFAANMTGNTALLAIDRTVDNARLLGADAIVAVRSAGSA